MFLLFFYCLKGRKGEWPWVPGCAKSNMFLSVNNARKIGYYYSLYYRLIVMITLLQWWCTVRIYNAAVDVARAQYNPVKRDHFCHSLLRILCEPFMLWSVLGTVTLVWVGEWMVDVKRSECLCKKSTITFPTNWFVCRIKALLVIVWSFWRRYREKWIFKDTKKSKQSYKKWKTGISMTWKCTRHTD